MSNSIAVGGVGATPSVDDVFKVARGELTVTLDPTAIGRVRKESPTPKNFVAEEASPVPADGLSTSLSREHARAALYVRTLGLITGKSGVRDSVIKALVELLNSRSHLAMPAGATDASVLQAAASCMYGVGTVFGEACEPLEVSSAISQLPSPALSLDERAQLCSGMPVTAGVLSVGVVRVSVLLSAFVPIVALSAEALRANMSSLEASNLESVQQRHPTAVAEELSTALDGSKLINPRKGGAGNAACITQVRSLRSPADHLPQCEYWGLIDIGAVSTPPTCTTLPAVEFLPHMHSTRAGCVERTGLFSVRTRRTRTHSLPLHAMTNGQ